MAVLHFDITNIVEYAKRTSTVIGIPRVQLNIISLLSREHGGSRIRCTFLDYARNQIFEFDPAELQLGFEFESDRLLRNLGVVTGANRWPTKGQVKSYLRQFSHNKLLRTWKKIVVYSTAVLQPKKLSVMGIKVSLENARYDGAVNLRPIDSLPSESHLVFLGAIWLLPELWKFGRQHHERGGVVVQMVYDLIPFIYPDYYTPREPPAFAAWLNDAFEYTTRFMCISKWTDVDLHKHAATRGHSITSKPIPLAHEFAGFNRTQPVPMPAYFAELQNKEYVLCVGTIEHRKNNVALLKIWQELLAEMPDNVPKLVFAGKLGRGGAEFQTLLDSDSTLASRVEVIHSPTDTDLAWLYQHCLFTVFPSQFEGWGLPVGEAAWFGKYTVATQATSVPEVCGDLIDYVDPHSLSDIKSGIKKVLSDRNLLSRRETAIANAKMRTWSEVAEDIFEFASTSP